MALTFDDEWARCAPWIEGALSAMPEPTHGADDVKALIERRECRFWAGRGSAIVTEVQVWPKARWLLIWLAGGDLSELVRDLLPMVEAYGREQQCSRCVVVGRPGWAKMLPGYQRAAVTVAKEL